MNRTDPNLMVFVDKKTGIYPFLNLSIVSSFVFWIQMLHEDLRLS